MRVDVIMPKMGESINEGTLIKWHKNKGDKVHKDEIIFEISTDKVDTEIPSPAEGVIVDIKVFEQETVEVDTLVAVIETDSDNAEVVEEPTEQSAQDTDSTRKVGGRLIDIPMPKMGESVMEGTIIKWFKKVGDRVERDEIIFEISTDKVDTEVPSPSAGVMAEILVKENETVEVDTVVARISASGGISDYQDQVIQQKIENAEITETEVQKKKTTSKDKISVSNRFYSPLVMNIARKEEISFDELEGILGSGLNGRVTKNDVLNYIKKRKDGKTGLVKKPHAKGQKVEPLKADIKTAKTVNGKEIIPMNNIRQKIMQHMIKSRDTSVHVSEMMEVDMTKIYQFIKANKEKYLREENIKLTYMPFISYSCIKALKEFPLVNASIEGDNIAVKKYINLGIAVAVEPNGLIVPNIKNADEKSVRGLAKAITELGIKSRTKGLLPDDVQDGTFSITNYGVFGALFGTPIINQPEVAILGVGTVTKKPVVIEVDGSDTIAVKPMMYLSLSHDHRLVDGMLGGMFLKSIKDTLENFDLNVL